MSNSLELPQVTLVSVTSIRIEETIKALKISSSKIKFNCIKLFTDADVNIDDIDVIKVPKMNVNDYNKFVIYELYKYIDTEFALQIQSDGYVANPEMWRKEFLDYDYIGAPWDFLDAPWALDRNGEKIRVGNGISLRSKKLMSIPTQFNMPWIARHGNYNEDAQICIWNRDLFLNNGVKFAPFEVAKYFSHEEKLVESIENGKRTLKTLHGVEYGDITPFCFHNYHGGEKNHVYKIS
jgi:hypothetical protein